MLLNEVETLALLEMTMPLVLTSLEKPDATSSSRGTGCIGCNGKKKLFLEPSLLLDEVEALVLLDVTTVNCGIAETIEVVSGLFVLIVVATKSVEALKTTDMELGVDSEV